MATKTISLDLEAYERLRRARQHPKESFSQVIRRARWDEPEFTGRHFLEKMARIPVMDEETLQRLEEGQQQDRPPRDKWTN